jgi:hypothetical protein
MSRNIKRQIVLLKRADKRQNKSLLQSPLNKIHIDISWKKDWHLQVLDGERVLLIFNRRDKHIVFFGEMQIF